MEDLKGIKSECLDLYLKSLSGPFLNLLAREAQKHLSVKRPMHSLLMPLYAVFCSPAQSASLPLLVKFLKRGVADCCC